MEQINLVNTLINLGPSTILGFISWKLWSVYQEQLDYNREQDKINLEQSQKILTILDKIFEKQGSGDKDTQNLINATKNDLITRIDSLIQHIKNNK